MEDAQAHAVHVGDLVTAASDDEGIWQVVQIRHGSAWLAARSIHLQGRRRQAPLSQLERYTTPDSDT